MHDLLTRLADELEKAWADDDWQRAREVAAKLRELPPDDGRPVDGWLPIETGAALPAVGEWVIVLTDTHAGSRPDLLPFLPPKPRFAVVPAQLRYVDEEGWPTWQRWELASGHPVAILEGDTHWQPLPTPPTARPEVDAELPGMWSHSDFTGGDPDERSHHERSAGDVDTEQSVASIPRETTPLVSNETHVHDKQTEQAKAEGDADKPDQSLVAYETAQEVFAEYFAKNYPGPNTIICDPYWHAPKLFRAAYRAFIGAADAELSLRNATAPKPAGCEAVGTVIGPSIQNGNPLVTWHTHPAPGTNLYAQPQAVAVDGLSDIADEIESALLNEQGDVWATRLRLIEAASIYADAKRCLTDDEIRRLCVVLADQHQVFIRPDSFRSALLAALAPGGEGNPR